MSNGINPIKVSAIASCFNGGKYLSAFLENCAEQTMAAQAEIVLVHNDPSEQELHLVRSFQERHPGLINHIIVAREPLAVSTNRAIKAAKGEYLCIWNVDDLRAPESLEIMAGALDANQSAGFTYGDFIIVRKWQEKTGRMVSVPEFEKLKFIQSMILGPFFMWRRSLCGKIGFWDEQFKSGADFDYASRLAVEAEGIKTKGLLGYYLDEGLGLSTGKTPWQAIERTVIELRFGVYHKLDFWYYKKAKEYRVSEILQDGVWQPAVKLMPHYRQFVENKLWLAYAVIRYPFWIIQRLINRAKRKV